MHEELFGELDVAIHDTVHEYVNPVTRKRGAVALAPRAAMSAGTLSNKANPTMPDHKLGLAESIAVQVASDDNRILYAYARVLGHCAYPLPSTTAIDDIELLDAYAEVQARAGDLAREIRDTLKDRRVTRPEVAALRKAFDEEVRAGLAMLARFEGLAE